MIATFAALILTHTTPAQTDLHRHHRHRPQFAIQDLTPAPTALKYIYPTQPVLPFKQWQANNGYCGEVSLVQSGMNQGQWMSQFNSRLICGTGLKQSGPDGWCEANDGEANYNSQVLLEGLNPGDTPFGSAPLCLANMRLAHEAYDYAHAPVGMDGYRRFLSWIKAQVIKGHEVTIAIFDRGGGDPQYDHEVTVSRIGTNHDPRDASYYDDDVLYFDDHYEDGPYSRGFTFAAMAKTRNQANAPGAPMYSILIPGEFPVLSAAGGDGIHDNPRAIVASNYAVAVSGPEDAQKETLPVTLTIAASTTLGAANAPDSYAKLNYESPAIGGTNDDACTNASPEAWMGLTLQAHVSGLTRGQEYNLYEYDFDGVTGVGTAAALHVPTSHFNTQAALAARVTRFIADGSTHTQMIETTSDKIVVLRCVRADAQ